MCSTFGRIVRRTLLLHLCLSVFLVAQSPIPCKYFPTRTSIDVDNSGGTIVFDVRADPAQLPPGKYAEYAKQCVLALESPAPWAHITDIGSLDANGYAKVTMDVEPNSLSQPRQAIFSIGTARTVYHGAAPHYANTAITIAQKDVPLVVTVNGNGAVNNASYVARVSPGTLFSIFGNGMSSVTQNGFSIPLPTSYSGTTVTMNGIACGLLYVSPTLINAQVPANLGVGTATVTVTYNGSMSSTTVPVVAASPGIFYNTSTNVAVAQHSNGVLVSTAAPAQPGEIIGVYGTGIGPVSPALSSGQAAGSYPNLSVSTSTYSATIGGANAPVSFLGLTPGLVGLMQLNVQIPSNTPGGNAPLLLSINGVASQPNVVIPVAGSAGTPVITKFSFSPSSVSPGQSTVLSWTTTGATSASINPGVGTVPPNGQITIGGSSPYQLPAASTTYTITAYSCTGRGCPPSSQPTAIATLTITPPPVASPVINYFTATPATITAGQTSTLGWSVSNATSVTITGLGSVGASGTAAVAPTTSTTYTLTATNSSGSRQAQTTVGVLPPPANVTLVFTNQLIEDATVSVNGTVIGTVSAGQTQQKTVPTQAVMNITYDVTATTTQGTAIGDPISGMYPTLNSPTGTWNFTINNYFANTNTYYFAPVITNTSGTDLAIAVNYGLQHQNECHCVVTSGAGPTRTGYYLFFSNSNVSAFNASSNYTGSYRYFDNLTNPGQGSGQVNLAFSVFP